MYVRSDDVALMMRVRAAVRHHRWLRHHPAASIPPPYNSIYIYIYHFSAHIIFLYTNALCILGGVMMAEPGGYGSSGVQRDGQGGGGAANGAPWPQGGAPSHHDGPTTTRYTGSGR